MNHIKYLLATIAAFTFVMLIIMTPVLVKAIQELSDQNKKLTSRIEELEKK